MAEETKIRFSAILEVMGKPKEHVEATIKKYVKTLEDNPNCIIIKQDYSDIKEIESMFSIFVELEMVVHTIQDLTDFCFSYMPSSIEIVKPEELKLKNHIFSGIMNDLQRKLHDVDSVAKKLKAENAFLKRNLRTSLSNQISIFLSVRGEATQTDISKFTGISEKELPTLLEDLEKEGKIKKEEDFYSLVKR